MQVKRIDVTDTKFKLTVKADDNFISSAKAVVLRKLAASQVKLPGFRSGKAPLNLVEKNVDPNVLQREFLEEAVNRMYVAAVKAEGIKPIANPKVSIKKFVPFSDLEIDAEVEGLGEIKLADYKNIKIKKPAVNVSEKDVKDVIEALRKRLAERRAVDRASKTGDEVIIDFKGSDIHGNPVSGAQGSEYPLIIGSKAFIPGFESNLLGVKKSQDKTFAVTFPADYTVKALQRKKVTFEVKVRTVNEISEPKVDNAFAAKAGPFKTLTELKADIKKQISAERSQQAEREFTNRLVNEITDKSTVAIPDVLISEQAERIEQDERKNLTYRGQTWQEHLKEEGITEQQHRQRLQKDSANSVKTGLLLGEIAEREGIDVTDEELESRIQLLKKQYKDEAMLKELDKPENRRDINNRILTEKTLAMLISYSK